MKVSAAVALLKATYRYEFTIYGTTLKVRMTSSLRMAKSPTTQSPTY